MPRRTITSANSVFMLAIPGLFDSPQQIQGFSADGAFTAEAFTSVEVVMGVDGRMSAGWVPVEKKMTVTIMPDSDSDLIFDAWFKSEEAQRELLFANGSIIIPAISRKLTLLKGVRTTYIPFPEVGRMLKARTFGLTWESILPSPI